MIAANELRIGNIVGRKYFNPNPKNPKQEIQFCYIVGLLDLVRVSLDLKGRDVLKCDYDLLEPIPLTPEILEKCGFEKYEPMMYRLKKGWHWITVDTSSIYIDGKQVKLIDHLHQLQNLYYALTGEELNYQP